MKMANVVPIYKRDDKQNVKTIDLFQFYQLSEEINSFFVENDLISPNQSVFKQGDFGINQLLSKTHDI